MKKFFTLTFQKTAAELIKNEEGVLPEPDNATSPDTSEFTETPTSPKEEISEKNNNNTTNMLFIGNDDNVKQKNVVVETESLVRNTYFLKTGLHMWVRGVMVLDMRIMRPEFHSQRVPNAT